MDKRPIKNFYNQIIGYVETRDNGDEVVRSSRHTNGAPEFKAPEKWDDDSILTEQSDIYSFGVVMFQCLAGQVPFPYDVKLRKHIAEFRLGEY